MYHIQREIVDRYVFCFPFNSLKIELPFLWDLWPDEPFPNIWHIDDQCWNNITFTINWAHLPMILSGNVTLFPHVRFQHLWGNCPFCILLGFFFIGIFIEIKVRPSFDYYHQPQEWSKPSHNFACIMQILSFWQYWINLPCKTRVIIIIFMLDCLLNKVEHWTLFFHPVDQLSSDYSRLNKHSKNCNTGNGYQFWKIQI